MVWRSLDTSGSSPLLVAKRSMVQEVRMNSIKKHKRRAVGLFLTILIDFVLFISILLWLDSIRQRAERRGQMTEGGGQKAP